MDKHALLDLIELLDEERRLNETLAFSSRDAIDQIRHATEARRDAAACSMAVFRPRNDARGGDGHLRDHPTIARAAPIRANLSGSTAWR